MSRLIKPLLLVFALSASAACLAQSEPLEVRISGAVLAPNTYSFAPGARLHDASRTAQVSTEAWPLGAALLRQSAIEAQLRLKAGVLFDLRVNRVHAIAEEKPALEALIDRFERVVKALPVTGRVVAQLNPLQQLLLANNDLLESGDHIVYPPRAAQVIVTGAVEQDCRLAFVPTQQPVEYLHQCARLPLADRNAVYVIQPDGTHQLRGIAHWNTEPANVAVGAVLYVPIRSGQLAAETPDLNQELAALLATQYQDRGRIGE
ncbi:capsule biosynthesis GfcC family protein [Pseudomonas saliphila]|uniref:capsule biosynthesis GfcC family protein n=1 Tax=Pseudomonas saliphila TaxID=2586906 RepID=UPI00123B3C7C|nr:capsule biosynthesis GfcC family protein [Pseudomonas saliphila]